MHGERGMEEVRQTAHIGTASRIKPSIYICLVPEGEGGLKSLPFILQASKKEVKGVVSLFLSLQNPESPGLCRVSDDAHPSCDALGSLASFLACETYTSLPQQCIWRLLTPACVERQARTLGTQDTSFPLLAMATFSFSSSIFSVRQVMENRMSSLGWISFRCAVRQNCDLRSTVYWPSNAYVWSHVHMVKTRCIMGKGIKYRKMIMLPNILITTESHLTMLLSNQIHPLEPLTRSPIQ